MLKRIFTPIVSLVILTAVAHAADLPDSLTGDGLSVRFDTKDDSPRGTLIFRGQDFPFTSSRTDDGVSGTFVVGEQSFRFTLRQNGDQFVLMSDGSKYALKPIRRNPLVDNNLDTPTNPEPAPIPAPRNVGNAGADGVVTLSPRTITDPSTKLPVVNLLVPQGWELNETVLWRPLAAQFVCLTSTVFDRQSGWALRWLPMDRFNCLPGTYASARQQGQEHPVSNGLELCDRVLDPQQFIQMIVLPRYRNIEGLRVVDAQNLAEYAKSVEQNRKMDIDAAAQAGQTMRFSVARVRVEYPAPGDATLQEDIYCVLITTWNEQANIMARNMGFGGGESYLFWPDQLYSFTAPKGQLDDASPLLQTIVSSVRSTPKWDAFVQNLNAIIQRMAFDQHAMEVAARQEITEIQQKTFRERSEAADKISNAVGDLLAGTQTYKNPNGGPPIVTKAGANAWISKSGQVMTSPNNQYNPNTAANGPGGTWTQLQP